MIERVLLNRSCGYFFSAGKFRRGPILYRHEKWCITCDALVQYAFAAAKDCGKLTLRDHLVLHALGVCWRQNDQEELARV